MIKNALSFALALILFSGPLLLNVFPTRADDTSKDQDRLQNAGQVAKEIMDIPDNIPQSLIDKADCVVVIPSVLKAAFHRRRQLRTRRDDVPQRR